MKVEVVKTGSLIMGAGEERARPELIRLKRLIGVGGGSTVILIKPDSGKYENILFDTGYDNETNMSAGNVERNKILLAAGLQALGVSPEQIDGVILSHLHLDHTHNLYMFPQATVFISAAVPKKLVDFFELRNAIQLADGEEIVPNLKAVSTPGHNSHHMAMLVEMDSGLNVACAGDSIVSRAHFDKGIVYQGNSDFLSIEMAMESVERIKSMADIIIPGHDQPFLNKKN